MSYQQPISTQLQPTIGMHPQGGNRNSKNVPVKSNGRRDWSNGVSLLITARCLIC